ncbi:MAG: MBL fold metallo-hydrolase [Nitrospinae bacterium]|nr:MBL fold metallo-hydrolase [Nitrospinota bacterium]
MANLTFLGTGTSTGIPMIGCDCPVCASSDTRDKRLRASIWVQGEGASVLVDTSTDLRAQALRAGIRRLDAVIYTHHHADHVHGIDELRSFNFLQKEPVACYGNRETLERIMRMFGYIFDDHPGKGGGKPKLALNVIEGEICVGSLKITPVPVFHGEMEIYGYRIGSAAYVTDCSKIPPASMKLLKGVDTLILGALGLKSHDTHFTVEKALGAIKKLAPRRAYLTHLNHNIGHKELSRSLPDNVKLAYDGLEVEI